MDFKTTMHYLNNQNELRDLYWKLAEDRKISIRKLAKEIGISEPTFIKWFTQNRDMSYKSVMRVIEFIEKNSESNKK